MDKPAISVIMPAYNHQKYVGAAIESVLAQTVTDFEFIIIDDGSTDSTAKVIQGYHDDRIRFVRQENADAYNVLNRGLTMASGKFIAILNSDDIYHRERLEVLLDSANKGGAVFFFTGVTGIDGRSQPLCDSNHPWLKGYGMLEELHRRSSNLLQVFFLGNFAVTTSNFFFERGVVERIGTFNPYRYAHDYDFLLRVLKCYGQPRVKRVPEKLLDYRVHSRNTLKENYGRVFFETCEIIVKHMPDFMCCDEDRELVSAALLPTLRRAGNVVGSITNSRSWKATAFLRMIGRFCGLPSR